MNVPPDKTIQLNVVSSPAHLPVVRAAVEKTCDLVGFDAETVGGIVLSVDEAMTNIIRHAYDSAPDRPIEVHLTPFSDDRGNGLRICLRDYGHHVDREEIKSRDLADVRPGGLGVHIISACMDEIDYSPASGGGTVLTMLKRLTKQTTKASKK